MNTIRLAEVSPTWGAHDATGFATRCAQSRAAAEADEIERDRQARKELLAEDFMSALEEGDLTARAMFAPAKRNGVRPAVYEVMFEALDYDHSKLVAPFMQLAVDCALGMPVQEKAAKLLQEITQVWAEVEADQ